MRTIIFGTATVLCFLLGVLLIKKEPRRIVNGFVLEGGLFLLLCTIAANAVGGNLWYAVAEVFLYVYNLVVFLLGIALIADTVMVIRKEGKSIPNILPFAFGVLALISAYAGYMQIISGVSGSQTYVRIVSVLNNIVLYVPLAIGAVLIYSIVYSHLKKCKNPDYIIVLGCSIRSNGEVTPLLRGRVDKAIKWYKNGGETAKFVVSGGQGSDEVISEAQSMKNYLLSQNIPEDKIIMENKSVNTKENLTFSKKCIEDDNNGSNILICTSNYHVLRSVILARSLGINAQGIGGHTALYYLPVAFLREYIAVIFRYKLLILVYIALAVLTGIFM